MTCDLPSRNPSPQFLWVIIATQKKKKFQNLSGKILNDDQEKVK